MKLSLIHISFRIHLVLHRLEEPYKEVFQLRVFGEISFSQIAAIFGKTESWARVTYPVSYTHLDVYKRQVIHLMSATSAKQQAGKVGTVIVKDMSRLGRNYLQVGMYTEMLFPQKGVRFIAINDGDVYKRQL